MSAEETEIRVYRYPLDPTPEQEITLRKYARAYRSTYNYGWAIKNHFQQVWTHARDTLVAQGIPRDEANKKAPKRVVPNSYQLAKIFRANRDLPVNRLTPVEHHGGPRTMHPWWHDVNENMCCQAFGDLDRAWQNWLAGRADYPRPKKHGRSRDSFRVQTITRLPDIRHVPVPGGGTQKRFTVRLQRPATAMQRTLNRHADVKGCGIKGVTFSREGRRWFASFNVRVPKAEPVRPDKNQRAAGTVGVDLGVALMAATSSPVKVAGEETQHHKNLRRIEDAERSMKRWQRRASRRWVKGKSARQQSAGWHEAQRHVARLHSLVAAQRRTDQHALTKALVTQFEHVVIEDLKVKNMTASAKGTVEEPGANVAQKSGLNREILRIGWGEIRRQLEYKGPWYGTRITVVNPAYTSRTCSQCGHEDAGSRRTQSEFRCTNCGHSDNADVNAAIQIRKRGLAEPGSC